MQYNKRVLRAPEAAKYTGLSESTLAKRRLYGLPPSFLNLGGRAIGYATLQKYATTGGGPEYCIFGNRALYTPESLDRWAASVARKVKLPGSTSGGRVND